MIVELEYRDGANYKTYFYLPVPQELLQDNDIEVGSEFDISDFDKTEEWLYKQTKNGYDSKFDHRIVEVVQILEESDDDNIIISDLEDGTKMFDGTRLQFKNSFFDNANNDEIHNWCTVMGSSLIINSDVIIFKSEEETREPKETRVYLINNEECNVPNDEIKSMSDDDFMTEAEKQGYVYTLKGFEGNYNSNFIDSTKTHIRII